MKTTKYQLRKRPMTKSKLTRVLREQRVRISAKYGPRTIPNKGKVTMKTSRNGLKRIIREMINEGPSASELALDAMIEYDLDVLSRLWDEAHEGADNAALSSEQVKINIIEEWRDSVAVESMDAAERFASGMGEDELYNLAFKAFETAIRLDWMEWDNQQIIARSDNPESPYSFK